MAKDDAEDGRGSKTPRVATSNKSASAKSQNRKRTSSERYWTAKSIVTCEKLKSLKTIVDKAIAEHKTFAMVGCYPSIRDALKQRGWVEKMLPGKVKRIKSSGTSGTATSSPGSSYDDDDISVSPPDSASSCSSGSSKSSSNYKEASLIARLLRYTPVDFFWTSRSDTIEWREMNKTQIVSRFPRVDFTNKVGLCNCMQQTHWYCESGSQILFPRCYNIGQGEDFSEFQADFQLTACLSLLKWLVATAKDKGEKAVKSQEGRVPLSSVEFAINRCNEYISTQVHEDIDKDSVPLVWAHQWDQFLTCYYSIINDNNVLVEEKDDVKFKNLLASAESALSDMKQHWPQLELDGLLNIWIVKPGFKSRGRGIILMNKLEDIITKVNPAMSKETRFVVQKYIERPLLIYNTKFDIRQWFLVTCAHPLTIWMYKESYLRFCSQSFSLRNMHESVHLTNNAVQSRYENGKRDSANLPDENMWDCYTFQTYLRALGHADKWEDTIYPGMRECIIGALLASQEHMDSHKNCFELFGADFMLTEDFAPWLIEINSCPCMSPSTSVTARMCAQCLEDVIKVVVDKRQDKNASTGMFELVYKQQIPPAPPYLGVSLTVKGNKISKTSYQSRKKPSIREASEDRDSNIGTHVEAKEKIRYVGPIIVDMIGDLAHHLNSAIRGGTYSQDDDNKLNDILHRSHSHYNGRTDNNGILKSVPPRKKHRKSGQKSTYKNRKKASNESVKVLVKEIMMEYDNTPVETKQTSKDIKEIALDMGDSEIVSNEELCFHDDHWYNLRQACLNKTPQDNIKFTPSFTDNCHAATISPDTKSDRPQTCCADLLAKLKLSQDNDNIEAKPSCTVDTPINWNEKLQNFTCKLAQQQYKEDPTSNSKDITAPASENRDTYTYSKEARRQVAQVNVMIDGDYPSNRASKSKHRLLIGQQVYNTVSDKITPLRSALPLIRPKFKPNDSHGNQPIQNFYAVGMSLKSIHSSLNQKESLILPLGSVPSLEPASMVETATGITTGLESKHRCSSAKLHD